MRIFKFILVMIFTLVFSACTFFSNSIDTEIITVNFPQWPPVTYGLPSEAFPLLKYWEVYVFSEDMEKILIISPEVQNIELEVKKNKPVSVTAYPITCVAEDFCICNFFKPAGNMYPYFCKEAGTKNLSMGLEWEKGFTAYVMRRIFLSHKESNKSLAETADYVQKFNWKKLQVSIDSKQNFNPWYCDVTTILSNISYRNFKLTYLSYSGVLEAEMEKFCTENNQFLISSYIPENIFIFENKKLHLIKSKNELFYSHKNYGINVNYESAKKYSVEKIYLPIYNREL